MQIKKQWRTPRKNDQPTTERKGIQPGDSGIWATCDKGREGKCIGELRDLFSEYAETLYVDQAHDQANDNSLLSPDDVENPGGIESEIQAEIAEMHQPSAVRLFTPLRIDVQCGELSPSPS